MTAGRAGGKNSKNDRAVFYASERGCMRVCKGKVKT